MKLDEGFKQSEKMLNELEAKIHKEYAQASKEMADKATAYFNRFKSKDLEQRDRYENGEISKKEYTEWRKRQMATGKRYIAMRDTLAKDLTNTDKIAMKMVNQALPDVYALNMNYGTYSIEKDSKINTSFTLYNHAAVERLIKDNPKLLPNPKVDIPKDLRWNQQHIQSAITQGILQGKSIPEIAKNLQSVTGMDERAAIRNARTAMTGAQNAGRLDSMKRAAARGIGVKKGWLSTLDNVTRDSHVDLDGEVQEIDRPFSNGLMYPADASGAPAEVYNCFIPETKIGVDSRIIRSYKHRYEGEVISIKSALGVEFTVTPNHPILTDRGWIAAKLLNEGDNLIVTSGIDNEVSRRNPNINHAFPRIDTIHQLFSMFGGKRTSDLRVNFHGDIPTSEVEIITQKGFLWSDVNAGIRKRINKFLFKYADAPLMRKCSFMKHFRRIMRTTFDNVSGVCKSFSFFFRSMRHSDIHGLRAVTDGNVVFGKDSLNNLPTNVVLPSEIKNGLARKVFLDNIVSVERSDFVGHVYNLQTDNNYYFVNSSISNNSKQCNGIMAIAHNCRCRLTHEYDKYKTDWSNPANRNTSKLGNMSYQEWKEKHKTKGSKQILPKGVALPLNKDGNVISIELPISDKLTGDKRNRAEKRTEEAKELINNLSNEYDSYLITVSRGNLQQNKDAGHVDVAGNMVLSNTSKDTILHEFAHTLATSDRINVGLASEDEIAFMKDITKLYTQYKKDCQKDFKYRISSYSLTNKDEFMAEAFTQIKAKEIGLKLNDWYGDDYTYSEKVLELIEKYFKKR